MIQNVLSDSDLFAICIPVLKPEYFDREFQKPVNFIVEYYDKYSAMPDIHTVNAECPPELEFTEMKVTKDKFQYTVDSIEKFCKQQAFKNAIIDNYDDIEQTGNLDKAYKQVEEAMTLSIQRDMGIELFDKEIEKRLKDSEENTRPIPTGISALDLELGGGMVRKQFYLFSANSGGGKSIMMNNIGINYALQGYNVLLLSLELPEDMILLRSSYIVTGVDSKQWKSHISEMTGNILECKTKGAGSFRIKRLHGSANTNDIKSFMKNYELEFGNVPDVLIIDYLDKMSPNGGTKNLQVFDQDKQKSEEVAQVLVDYDMIGISASQQTRDALRNNDPDQDIIAGGISKINTVDYYMSILMTKQMRSQGEMFVYFLKKRSNDGVGNVRGLHFNTSNLRILDEKDIEPPLIEMLRGKVGGEDVFSFDESSPEYSSDNGDNNALEEAKEILIKEDKFTKSMADELNQPTEIDEEASAIAAIEGKNYKKVKKKKTIQNQQHDDGSNLLSLLDDIHGE